MSFHRFETTLASGVSGKVVRIDVDDFAVKPFFLSSPSTVEEAMSQVLGQSRLGRSFVPIRGKALDRVRQIAQRPANTIPLGNLHSMRLQAIRCQRNELMINANYFLFNPEELDTGYDTYGDPIGMVLSDGTIHYPPQEFRSCLLMTEHGAKITRLSADDCVAKLSNGDCLSTKAGQNGQLFFRKDGIKTPELPMGYCDVVFVGPVFSGLFESGVNTIPRTGCIMRLDKDKYAEDIDAWQSGQLLEYELMIESAHEVHHAVQAGPLLIANGELMLQTDDLFREESLWNSPDTVPVSPSGWPADWHRTRATRLAAGIDESGQLFFCAIEGSSSYVSKDAPTTGATMADVAELMLEQGAATAMNLDGGGSVQIFGPGGGSFFKPSEVFHQQQIAGGEYERTLPLGLKIRVQ